MEIKNFSVEFEMANLSDAVGPDGLPPGVDSSDLFPRDAQAGFAINFNPSSPILEFDKPPTKIAAFLTGFSVSFAENRPLGLMEVRLGEPKNFEEGAGGSDTKFWVPIRFGLRDWSGDWDDRHAATIHVAVLAE